ncbi:hypothetical protein BH11PSE11_BH11PSE11_06550 [soil metagenome]
MTDIRIHQAHALSHKKAKAAAQKVAAKLADEYDMQVEWEGDVLKFKRSGVAGTLTLEGNQAQLDMKLGMFLAVFAPTIEARIAENMKTVFADKA